MANRKKEVYKVKPINFPGAEPSTVHWTVACATGAAGYSPHVAKALAQIVYIHLVYPDFLHNC